MKRGGAGSSPSMAGGAIGACTASPAAPAERYTGVAIALHWLVALLVVAQVAWGWAMQEIPKFPPGLRADAFNVHKSIGLTILALMLVRIAWRVRHPPPALPAMPPWQRIVARGNHVLLYAALLVMPLAGYLGSVFSGYPVKVFGATLPAWAARDETLKAAMSSIHLVTSWVLVGAIVLHVAGALKHALDEGDRVVARMLPRWRAASKAERERRLDHAVKAR